MATNQNISELGSVEKVEKVRSYFDRTDNYIPRRGLDIRLRAETVAAMMQSRNFRDILDIGCGDGSISTPLLTGGRRLTLLSLSPNMLSIANSRVPADLAGSLSCINQDFLAQPFVKESFDLVICLGVIAHVTSPENLIAKIASVLRPGGTLIMEWTDAFHFVGLITVLYNTAAAMFNKPSYNVNLLSTSRVLRACRQQGLESAEEYRYALALPGTSRFFTPDGLYQKTRQVFGSLGNNRNAWLGNQHIHCFVRK